MAKYRAGRVRQEILREVNNILLLEIKDPRVEGVTITDVNVTGDLQQATIYYSTLSDKAGERQKTQRGLDAITGKVRRDLGKKLTLYKTPEIKFERDRSIDYGSHIDSLLNQIKVDYNEESDNEA
ncbi:MAG: 30S ribosome-binding factor RbfA [Ruoffia tabacinasalis]|uniref:30S ribosome-binding factor RbfA n=1 Tax=unclassified Ruoffia TaxID=2862149 RepID=UPI000EED9FDA|nr:30S ribosome-binding factor RbfA [Aerococcaceae bacterium]